MEKIIKEVLVENDCLIADGFDNAIIGTYLNREGEMVAVYSIEKCINSLMNNDGMDYEQAEEFFYYNTINCYMGVKTPIFIETYKE